MGRRSDGRARHRAAMAGQADCAPGGIHQGLGLLGGQGRAVAQGNAGSRDCRPIARRKTSFQPDSAGLGACVSLHPRGGDQDKGRSKAGELQPLARI